MAVLLLTGSAVYAVPTSAWMNTVLSSLSLRRNLKTLLVMDGARDPGAVLGAFGVVIYDPGEDGWSSSTS